MRLQSAPIDDIPVDVMLAISIALQQEIVRVLPFIRNSDGRRVYALANPVPDEMKIMDESVMEHRIFALVLEPDMLDEYAIDRENGVIIPDVQGLTREEIENKIDGFDDIITVKE